MTGRGARFYLVFTVLWAAKCGPASQSGAAGFASDDAYPLEGSENKEEEIWPGGGDAPDGGWIDNWTGENQDESQQQIEDEKSFAVYEPGNKEFLSVPFPSDAFRAASGGLDLSVFPNPNAVPIVEMFVDAASLVLDGWSVVQVIYFRFKRPIEPIAGQYVPASSDAPVQLVDVTDGPDFGTRIPLLWHFREEAGLYVPENTLMVRPVWGFLLMEGHTYAAIVTEHVRDRAGNACEPPSQFLAAIDKRVEGHAGLVESLEPLRLLLEKESALRPCVATVFTVGRPTNELRVIRDFLWKEMAAPAPMDIRRVPERETSDFYWYEGHYLAPNFLKGKPPYLEDGYFEFDDYGRPIVQVMEKMRFALIIPKGKTMPAKGWPLVIHAHGTGGQYDSHMYNPGRYLAQDGIASIGIDQPLHGERCNPPLSQEELAIYSFNFLNVLAGRSVQRQSVPDVISVLRMIQAGNLKVPQPVSGAGREEKFDTQLVAFFGHSQGGITGGMLFGVEDRIAGGVLSGAGGGLTYALLLRKDVVDFAELLRGFLEITDADEFNEFHPVLSLAQMLIEASDPIAYSPFYFDYEKREQGTRPRHIFMTEGMHDEQTPPKTTEALAAGASIPVLSPFQSWPLGLSLKGVGPVSTPVSGNIVLDGGVKVTAALAQFPYGDHFVVFDDGTARSYYRKFMKTLVQGLLPTIE